MYTVIANNINSILSIECKNWKEACELAYKLKGQFVNIQRDNEIIYNKISYDTLGNIIFENIWAKDLLE